VRNKKTTCTATVIHRRDSFTTNNKPHTHESKPGILTNVLIAKKIIENAKADIFTSAPTVVEKMLTQKTRIFQIKLQQHSQYCKQTSADRFFLLIFSV
jgi:hypothetical protein